VVWPVATGLAHFLIRGVQRHHTSARDGYSGLRNLENLAKHRVEASRDIFRQFYMLPLIIPNRNKIGTVQKYVGGHQHGIGEEAASNRRPAFYLSFELSHALQPSKRGDTVEQPHKFRVLGNVGLGEYDRRFRVYTRR
jgi:hypothetical protein